MIDPGIAVVKLSFDTISAAVIILKEAVAAAVALFRWGNHAHGANIYHARGAIR